MKKVILLSGSPRKKGNTAQLLAECARVIEQSGVETEIVTLAGRDVRSCVACGKCEKQGKCSLDDGLNEIMDLVRNAKGFIVGSPVYFGAPRGDVLSALQRIGMVSKASDDFLSGKVGGPIAVARRGGHTVSLQQMLMFFLINDMVVPGSSYWNMVVGRQPGEAMYDEEGVDTIRRFGENVARLVNSLYD